MHSESDRGPSNALFNQVFHKIKLAVLWEMDIGGLLRRYFGHRRLIGMNFKDPPCMDSSNVNKAHSCFSIDFNAWC